MESKEDMWPSERKKLTLRSGSKLRQIRGCVDVSGSQCTLKRKCRSSISTNTMTGRHHRPAKISNKYIISTIKQVNKFIPHSQQTYPETLESSDITNISICYRYTTYHPSNISQLSLTN